MNLRQIGPILLLTCVGLFLMQGWAKASERARVAGEDAEYAIVQAERMRGVMQDSLSALRSEKDSVVAEALVTIDSLTSLPDVVSAVAPEVLMVLDTATLNEEVAIAVQVVRDSNLELREENTELRTRLTQVGVVSEKALADQALLFEAMIATRDDILLEVQAALDAQVIATETYKKSATLSFGEKALWVLVGAGTGATLSSITR